MRHHFFKKGSKKHEKTNKLVALLLAVVMVLGMMPTMAVHTHAAGLEDCPAIALDAPQAVEHH